MPPYSWLLFDADGTLFDYDLTEVEALQNVFDHYQLPLTPETRTTFIRVNQAAWSQLERREITLKQLRWLRFANLFAETGIDLDAHEFGETYVYYLGRSAHLIPGTLEVLAQLHGRFRLGIITNGIHEVQHSRVRLSGLGRYFPFIFTSEALGVYKPAQGFFDAVFAGIGQPQRESVLVIGDSLTSDIAGGVGYGLDTCWYNPQSLADGNGYPITYEIRELQQLLDILGVRS